MWKNKHRNFLLVGVLFFTIASILYVSAYISEKRYYFNGIIQEITIGDKGTPKVIINGQVYFIRFPNEDFKNKIKKNDSLIKMKNSSVYKLVKYKTNEIILSE